MVKIFIGNLTPETESNAVEELFAKYGTVTECAKYTNFAFVHMMDRKCASKAIRDLNQYPLNGRPMNVELSRGKNQVPVKLHIANVEPGSDNELRELFEEYGTVTECAVVKNFAFVHMLSQEEASDAIEGLDNKEFKGKRIHVQISRSRPKGYPGEEEQAEHQHPPYSANHYPPRYPQHHPPANPDPYYRNHVDSYYTAPPQPQPQYRRPSYPERPAYGTAAANYYQKYRPASYTSAGYDDRRAIPPPPPPSAQVRERLGLGPATPYERRPLPQAVSYTARDRSPIRRVLHPPTTNGHTYERSRLSPVSKAPSYALPRPRDAYSNRATLAPPHPPASRYAGY